jgi:phosphoglycolate phosphatase-like HAD superfamily hydrolase
LRILTDQLLVLVNERVAAIKSGAAKTEDWLVPGSKNFLQSLRARNVTCYIASGTAEEFVRAEAVLLGIAPFFADIFGAHTDYKNHSKKIIIGQIVAKHTLKSGELITFGDGMPEIADTKTFGGIAVGVASNEGTRNGINKQKRAVLVQAGADLILPDFCESAEVTSYLFSENNYL